MRSPTSARPPDPLSTLHPLITAAARGELPDWAEADEKRRQHMASVAQLMGEWAEQLGLEERDRTRWIAAGWLHDALRDADPGLLIDEAGEYPERLRHGPAAAARMGAAGVDDGELLDAVRHHSTGWPGLHLLGCSLYLADYLDPRRKFGAAERAALRRRLPEAHREVAQIVCARRIRHMLDHRIHIMPETFDFWNQLVGKG